jgi:hypothetical protein
MRSSLRTSAVCLAVLALAACHAEKKSGERRSAAGEILQGSASDAMLPYDTVRSQAPLAPDVEGSGKPAKGKDKDQDKDQDKGGTGQRPSAAASKGPTSGPAAESSATPAPVPSPE